MSVVLTSASKESLPARSCPSESRGSVGLYVSDVKAELSSNGASPGPLCDRTELKEVVLEDLCTCVFYS